MPCTSFLRSVTPSCSILRIDKPYSASAYLIGGSLIRAFPGFICKIFISDTTGGAENAIIAA